MNAGLRLWSLSPTLQGRLSLVRTVTAVVVPGLCPVHSPHGTGAQLSKKGKGPTPD